jgi:hypothetical protein
VGALIAASSSAGAGTRRWGFGPAVPGGGTGLGSRSRCGFPIFEERPFPLPTALGAFHVGRPPPQNAAGAPSSQPRKVMTFPGCALAPGARQAAPAAHPPPPHTQRRAGVGGGVQIPTHGAGVVRVRGGGRLAPAGVHCVAPGWGRLFT